MCVLWVSLRLDPLTVWVLCRAPVALGRWMCVMCLVHWMAINKDTIRMRIFNILSEYIYIYIYIYIRGGPLSALPCCVIARLLSRDRSILKVGFGFPPR